MATAHNGFPPALASMAVRVGPGDAPSTWRASTATSPGFSVWSRRVRAPPAARSSSSRTTSAGSGDGRAVTTTSNAASGNSRATDKIAKRLAVSAQWISSATSSTGRSAHDFSTRSTISSTTRYWRSPAARAGASAPWPASSAPIAARRGSDDRRFRSSAAATTPNGRVRSKGWAWPQNTAMSRERASSTMLCTRRVLPMPASPSMASADACPSLSWRTAAAARASSASRPTSPSAEDTPNASPTPKASPIPAPESSRRPAKRADGQPKGASQEQT